MESNGSSKLNPSGTSKEECSETTVEIKIKTLDSRTYTLRVDKYVPVPALKEQIAGITGVLSEQQRLICRGKVLKDDQLLSAYHVEDGHTLHLVVRQPIDSSSTSMPTFGSNSGLNHGSHSGNSGLGSVNVLDQGVPVASDFGRIFSSVIGSLGISSFGMASSREQDYERNGRTPGSGSPADSTQPQADHASVRTSLDSYLGGFRFPSATSPGGQHPTVIPDSCTTLTHYMDHIRREFVSNGGSFDSNSQATDSHGSEGQDPHLNSTAIQGLPTPESLAEVILSARQLLMEIATGCLSDLVAQLQDQGNVADPQARANIQSNAMRYGVLVQNLGPLFLELGRTIMTLRMGQTQEEALVNAGPAIFVSSTGPNPIMVQAGTTFSGISMGALQPGHGPAVGLGPGLVSRNIDITIRRAQANENVDGQTSGQQSAERTDTASVIHQAFQGISGRASNAREPTVRVVPIRTVIAIPGANHRSSDSSGSGDTSVHPLFARLQQQIPGNMNDARNPLVSSEQRIDRFNQHVPPDSGSEYSGRMQNNLFTNSTSTALEHPQCQEGNPGASRVGNPDLVGVGATEAQGRGQYFQNVVGHSSNEFCMMEQFPDINSSIQTTTIGSAPNQINTGTEEQNPSRQDNEDGIFFSALVRQLMPLLNHNTIIDNSVEPSLHQDSSAEHLEGQNLTDAMSHPDSSDAPSSKRQKRD